MTAAFLTWGVDWMKSSISTPGFLSGATSALSDELRRQDDDVVVVVVDFDVDVDDDNDVVDADADVVEQALFRRCRLLGLEAKTSEGEALSSSESLDSGGTVRTSTTKGVMHV